MDTIDTKRQVTTGDIDLAMHGPFLFTSPEPTLGFWREPSRVAIQANTIKPGKIRTGEIQAGGTNIIQRSNGLVFEPAHRAVWRPIHIAHREQPLQAVLGDFPPLRIRSGSIL